jgi:signal transduction histidine kinase
MLIEQKIGAGYLVAVLLSLLIGIVASYALQSVVISKDRVADIYASELIEVERLRATINERAARLRGFLLTSNAVFEEEAEAAQRDFEARLGRLRARAIDAEETGLLDRIGAAERAHREAVRRVLEAARAGGDRAAVARMFEDEVVLRLRDLSAGLDALDLTVEQRLETARARAVQASTRAAQLVLVVAGAAVLLAAGLGFLFTRTIERMRRAAEERQALLSREQRARTEAERARQELSATVQQLQQVNADLDAFAGRIAHDLRNILAPIALVPARLRRAGVLGAELGSSERSPQRPADPEAAQRIVASLERSITRANAVLEGLLAFSRSVPAEGGGQPASVREVIDSVMEELAPLASDVQAEVELSVEDALVACPPELLHVVVLNLLGNALKYIAGCAQRHVWVRAHPEGEGVRIVVEDSGPGIPEEARRKLFEPFYRVPGVRAKGTGIGLATVRRIVLAHGGQLDFTSELGKGTTFHVWLPSAREPLRPDERGGRKRPPPSLG